MTATVLSRSLDRNYKGESWESLKRFHISWAAYKATEGLSFVSDAYQWNRDSAAAAEMASVIYHFAHPELSASAQVDHFLSTVKPKVGDALVCDLERGTTQAATNRWTKTFLTGVRKGAPGCAVGLYMGTGYAGTATGAGMSDYADFWWCPRYPGLRSWPTVLAPQLNGNTTGWPMPHIWQWTDRFAGRYDANVSTLTATQIVTPKGTDMPLTAADIQLLLNTPINDPRDPTGKKHPTLATWLRYADIEAAGANAGVAAQATQIATLQAQVQALQEAQPALVRQAVTDAITAGLVTVQINAKETP